MLNNCERKIGEVVVYRKQGMYKIQEIKEQEIGGISKNYYVLRSVYDSNSSLYVPTDAENISEVMEYILTKDEIHKIIEKSKESAMSWIENSGERSETFNAVIKEGDLVEILRLLRLFIERKAQKDQKPVRNFARDEKVLSMAQKIISEAFAYPLGLTKSEVIDYIFK